MDAEPIIRVENVTAGYDDLVVLEDISFEVGRGEVFVILGGSGCGKSTLLNHMIGLIPPMAGRILIDGDDMVSADGDDRHRILKKIGVMFQTGALFGSMTLHENVRLGLEEFTDLPREAADLVTSMKLDMVGLREFGHHMPSEVSGGMQKRAAIARAMALDPQILLMDEPSAGLDPITSAELDDLVLSLARSLNMTFVIVTHELPSVNAVADRVIMLTEQDKGIVAEGTPADLERQTDNPLVWQFFHRKAGHAAGKTQGTIGATGQ